MPFTNLGGGSSGRALEMADKAQHVDHVGVTQVAGVSEADCAQGVHREKGEPMARPLHILTMWKPRSAWSGQTVWDGLLHLLNKGEHKPLSLFGKHTIVTVDEGKCRWHLSTT